MDNLNTYLSKERERERERLMNEHSLLMNSVYESFEYNSDGSVLNLKNGSVYKDMEEFIRYAYSDDMIIRSYGSNICLNIDGKNRSVISPLRGGRVIGFIQQIYLDIKKRWINQQREEKLKEILKTNL